MSEMFTAPAVARPADRRAQPQSQLQGQLIVPGDSAYDSARRAWNLTVDQHPAAVIMARDAEDIVAAVRYAASEELDITVQATGHGVVRPADGALLVNTSRMKEVVVDSVSRTAWVGAGAKWGDVLAKTQEVGLAPLLGSSPDVGAVGYTLGGGFGWLGRKYGLSTDSVRFFEVVTAQGDMLRASDAEYRDLFWALRGGGGAYAIVTGMEIQLYPVSTVYAGSLYYPVAAAREVYAHFRDWIVDAPDELTSSVVMMNYPPVPSVPEPMRGQSFAIVRGCFCGPAEEGERLLRSWREWRTPVIDAFQLMPFAAMASISNDPVDPIHGKSTGAWLRELSPEVIEVLVENCTGGDGTCPLVFAEVRNAGGAVSRVARGSNAYGNREAQFLLQMIGLAPTREAYDHLGRYTDRIKQQLQAYLTGGVYMNFLEGSESRRRVQDGYSPEDYRRLQSLKATYDPENRLRSGFDLSPAS